MKIAIGSDHGGFEAKEHVKQYLEARKIKVIDVGCWSRESVDYPDYAAEVARRVSCGEACRQPLAIGFHWGDPE